MISKASSYAIQALTYLSLHTKDREYVPISEIADELSIPYHFLKKILAQLVQSGILTSQRSAKGGVAITNDGLTITLYDVITLIDGDSLFTECILSLPGCGEGKPCPLHSSWSVERSRIKLMFSSTTLADVARRVATDTVKIGH